MAKYSYNELKRAAQTGERIGGWKSKNVYSVSQYNYDETKSHFYVLYDDGNKVVCQGKVYGTINASGIVTECTPYYWNGPVKKQKSMTQATKSVPATTTVVESVKVNKDVDAEDFFLRIDREINALLAETANKTFDMGEWKI